MFSDWDRIGYSCQVENDYASLGRSVQWVVDGRSQWVDCRSYPVDCRSKEVDYCLKLLKNNMSLNYTKVVLDKSKAITNRKSQ